MLTNAQPVAAGRIPRLETQTVQCLIARAFQRLNQWLCGLGGHSRLMHFEEGRVTMRCVTCGHETAGWAIGERRPRPRFAGDPARHQLIRPSLHVISRRSA